ncbi:MAG: RNA-binding domain-containing protein [Methanosarcinaceae archaeon]
MDLEEFFRILNAGENEQVEFKQRIKAHDAYKEIVALANSMGGLLIIGVDDDRTVVGTDVDSAMEEITSSIGAIIPYPVIRTERLDVEGRSVLIVKVERSHQLLSVGGVAYIRLASGIRPLSIQEILDLSTELGVFQWDNAPYISVSEMVQRYVDHFFSTIAGSKGIDIPENKRMAYLKRLGAIKDDKLTNAGVLFFTDVPQHMSQAGIRIVQVVDDEPVSSKIFEGPLWMIIDEVYGDLIKQTGSSEVVVHAKRERVNIYPPRMMREALINAVAHRNYAIDADIRVFIHPRSLTIRNPGGLLPGVDIEDPEHVPRNPSLCNLLFEMGFIERYGYGIRMMKKMAEDDPLLSLELLTSPNRFDLTMSRHLESLLDDTDKKVLVMLSEPSSSSVIASQVGLSKPALLVHLKRLESLGLIKKTGAGPSTRYSTQH